MLSSISPLRARSSIISAIGCICGPSGLSRNPPCGFQLFEPPLPFLVLLVPQDSDQVGRLSGTEARSCPARFLPLRLLPPFRSLRSAFLFPPRAPASDASS